MGITFDNSWIRSLPGSFIAHRPDRAPAPRVVAFNSDLARDLGLDPEASFAHAAAWFSGADLPEGAEPVALAYAGHQFGGFSPSLGDGRAHLLGEILTPEGARFDLQLKGSGRTPFSRGADGKAALGPMLREFLISESLAGLGVPTSRSLAVTTTGEMIVREGRGVAGAVVARVASSHLRIGSFEYYAARGDIDALRRLADYAIARHYRDLADREDRYLAFFDQVTRAQARLIAAWMGVGFVHGVMNTDNMTISGESLDFGPCAFLEAYAPGTVFSSIDRQGRYAYANQPKILAWNLARLAEALLPLLLAEPGVEETALIDTLNARLEGVAALYHSEWRKVMAHKLGLGAEDGAQVEHLAEEFLSAQIGADFTLGFYHLAAAAEGNASALMALGGDAVALERWLPSWRAALGGAGVAGMRAANPAVIARNHRVEEVIVAAAEGDMRPFQALWAGLRSPYVWDQNLSQPAPASFGRYVTFCGT